MRAWIVRVTTPARIGPTGFGDRDHWFVYETEAAALDFMGEMRHLYPNYHVYIPFQATDGDEVLSRARALA